MAKEHEEELAELDPALGELVGMMSEAEIQITEAADSLRAFLDQDQPDAADLATIESRLTAMHDLARKHRVEPAELPDLTEKLREELHAIEHADDTLEDLRKNVDISADELQKLSKKLSAARRKAATSLGKKVSANMQQLGMPEGKFSVDLKTLDAPGPAGMEREGEALRDLRVTTRREVREQRGVEDQLLVVPVVAPNGVFADEGFHDPARDEAVGAEVVDDAIRLALEVEVRILEEHAVDLRGGPGRQQL